MDFASVIGFVFGLFFVIMYILPPANFISGELLEFVNWQSFMCAIGGSAAVTLIGYPLTKVMTAMKALRIVIFPPASDDVKTVIRDIVDFANLARKEGLITLEHTVNQMENRFLRKGLLLVVDGTEAHIVKNILETDLSYTQTRHKEIQEIWSFIASVGPAWGVLGIVIGLANALGNSGDSALLGSNIAMALITTFYGIILAYFLALPVSRKLAVLSAEETLIKELIIEGLFSIQVGENPKVIEEKLKSFLAPSVRSAIQDFADDSDTGE